MELPIPRRNTLLLNSILLMAFAIPWAKRAIPSFIAVALLIACYNIIRRKTLIRPTDLLAPVGMFALFLLLIIGSMYSENPVLAWNEIGMKLSLFVFPLLAFITPSISRNNINKIEYAFIGGCFFFLGIATIHSAYETIQHRDFYYATYDRLSWYIHPTYAAQYQAFTLYLLFAMAIEGRFLLGRLILHVIAIGLVLLFIVLLSSKAGYVTALLVLFFLIFRSISSGISKVKSISAFVLMSSIFVLVILNLPSSSQRVENAIADFQVAKQKSQENDTTPAQGTSTQMRIVTWKSALTVLIENPFGTGTGDTQHALNTIYLVNSETLPAEKNLNAHNQFLQFGAELGWPGLLMLLFILYALWQSNGGHYNVRIFALICALNFLFESMLETQAGIVFFCFWLMIYSKVEK